MMYVGWGFGSFLFYKIATALLLPEPMNVIAALIGGICAGGLIFVQGQFIGPRLWREDTGGIVLLIIATAGGMMLALWLIVQGFDQGFAEAIDWPDYEGYGTQRQKLEVMIFEAIAAAPLIFKGIVTTLMFRAVYKSK